ncbi:MAG: 50S ribosomal protein L11 methyltransferase [Armatimonadota bacterium]
MSAQEVEYTEITIVSHPEAAEGLVDVLLSLGANGVAEERRPLNLRLTAYLPKDDQLEEKVRAIRQRLTDLEREGLRIGPGTVGLRTLEGKAWSEAWKDQFQVLKIAPGLAIVPSWEEYQPQEGESVVVLEPGAAFGTGGHATTRLCLRGLVLYMRPGYRVADVGCGSGILAITAAVLGAREVLATDTDRTCLPVAQANARRNGVGDQVRFVEADLLPSSPGQYDLIVCNIVAEEAIRLAESLPGVLAKGGCCVASGFVPASLPRVEDAFTRAGLRIVETPSEEGWAACVATRPARG